MWFYQHGSRCLNDDFVTVFVCLLLEAYDELRSA
jgi:hypothetical protein